MNQIEPILDQENQIYLPLGGKQSESLITNLQFTFEPFMRHLFTNEFMSKPTKKGREGRGEAMCKNHSEHSMLESALTQIGRRQHARILTAKAKGLYVAVQIHLLTTI